MSKEVKALKMGDPEDPALASTQGRIKIRTITKDVIRDILLPNHDSNKRSTIVTKGELCRIMKNAKTVSQADQEAAKVANRMEKELELERCRERRMLMQKIDAEGAVRQQEEQRAVGNQAELERAELLKAEQTEELRHMNKKISAAMCRAAWDIQLSEHKKKAHSMGEDATRLSAIIESVRLEGLQKEAAKEEMAHQKCLTSMQHLLEQQAQKERQKKMDLQRQKQEAKHAAELVRKQHIEDLQAMERKHAKQLQFRAEIKANKAELEVQHAQLVEQRRLADERINLFVQQREERMAEQEALKKRTKYEREMEIARLRKLQERAQDRKADEDEKRARSHQEAAQRQWCIQQIKEAAALAEHEAKLCQERSDQIEAKLHRKAVQLQMDKLEFQRTLQAQNEAFDKELKEMQAKREAKAEYTRQLEAQIQESKSQKMMEHSVEFREGEQRQLEEKEKRLQIERAIQKKLDKLRDSNLRADLIAEVARNSVLAPRQ
uniref:cilia- and flagella-associated protein 45-like isoform X1 n=2 Tax=Myxine glutinosa TaxID=7769 RepID=UPI003590135C